MTVGSRWVIVLSGGLLWACAQDASQTGTATAQRPYPIPQLTTTGEVVAQAGAVKITTDELTKRLAQQGPIIIERMADPARRKQFLQEQVRFELLAQDAWARGLQDQPEVIQELKKVMVQRLIRDELERRTKDAVISEADLHAAYKASFDEYNKPETVRLSQIVRRVSNDAERKKAHALLDRLEKEITAAEKRNKASAFSEAARTHSEDEGTRFGGGELQFMSRKDVEEKYGPEVAEAAFVRASVGDMVVADATDAVVLFKKTGLRRAVERTLEMVKPQIRAKVQREQKNAAFETFFEELEKKYGVTYDLEVLGLIKLGNAGTATATRGAP